MRSFTLVTQSLEVSAVLYDSSALIILRLFSTLLSTSTFSKACAIEPIPLPCVGRGQIRVKVSISGDDHKDGFGQCDMFRFGFQEKDGA